MKMGIKAKLLTGFLCSASLTLIAGLVGLYSSNRLGNMLGEMYSDQLTPIIYLAEADKNLLERSRGLYRLIIETEDKEMRTVIENGKNMKALLRNILKYTSPSYHERRK
jgi:phosphoglycerate-specific signal transduction histidine kinase